MMTNYGAVVALAGLLAGLGIGWAAEPAVRCSEEWYRAIDERVSTGDGAGHGPDVGSDEWKSTVEFKLGVRGAAGVPARDGDAWCVYVDGLVRAGQGGGGPSFSCAKVEAGGIEEMICKDAGLSALDRKLAGAYALAAERATNEHPPVLKAEQRGWVKGRDECWKSDDRRRCVEDAYTRRIAELQARYRLVTATGPVTFACDDNAASEVVVDFFPTEPPTLIAERGDTVSLMYLEPAASGSKYQGRNESFWGHGDEATIVWGYGAPVMRCKKQP